MTEQTVCWGCCDSVSINDCITMEYYYNPDDPNPASFSFCNEQCLDDFEEGDFAPYDCPYCDRAILQRNPNNGYENYFTYSGMNDEDDYEQICRDCFNCITFGTPENHTKSSAVKNGVSCLI